MQAAVAEWRIGVSQVERVARAVDPEVPAIDLQESGNAFRRSQGTRAPQFLHHGLIRHHLTTAHE
jgi:hypothetical protein